MGIINRDIEADAVAISVEGLIRGLAPAMPDGWSASSIDCSTMFYTTGGESRSFTQWSVQATLGSRARCIGCGPTLQLALDNLHLDATAKVAMLDALNTEASK